jgi:hypothetical protein
MGSVSKDVDVPASSADVWDAMRDYGAVHKRVAPGFVVDCYLDGVDRVITFASGGTARERLVSLDDQRKRLVYTVVEGRLALEHHQGSVEVSAHGPAATGSRIVWITDFLPDELEQVIEGLMTQGAAAMIRAFSVQGNTS